MAALGAIDRLARAADAPRRAPPPPPRFSRAQRQLLSLETKIHDLEGTYLHETASTGNILKARRPVVPSLSSLLQKRRALLTPKVNPGSFYGCHKRT